MVIRFHKILSCALRDTALQSAARSARWGYHGYPSQRAVRAAKIKLIVASRRALRKRTVKFLQRMVVSAPRTATQHAGRYVGGTYRLYMSDSRGLDDRVDGVVRTAVDFWHGFLR